VVDATRQARDNNIQSENRNSNGSSSNDTSAAIKAEVTEWIKKEEEETKYKVSTVATEVDPWL
jgi:DNA recombination-dependent growth factor C